MDDDEELWANVEGIDSDGPSILADLKRLQAGELDDDQASELMCDLTRDGSPSTAGYAAIPLLLADNECASIKTRLDMVHTACLVLGRANLPHSPKVDPAFQANFTPEIKTLAFRKLFQLAAELPCRGYDLISVCAAALLLDGRDDLDELLIDNHERKGAGNDGGQAGTQPIEVCQKSQFEPVYLSSLSDSSATR